MGRVRLVADAGFTEVADRVWVARHRWLDVNVSVVEGSRGLVVVDTLTSDAAGRRLVAELRRLRRADVVAVVNTHEHWDHTFGNAALRAALPGVPVHAHEEAARRTVAAGRRAQEEYAGEHGDDGHGDDRHGDDGTWAEVRETEPVAADHTFSSVRVLDLGDRAVELVHPGRGHTGGDCVVSVPDAGVLLAGDLVEESGPPAYGPDCFPLDWPGTLDLVVGMLPPDAVVVPGHGTVVDPAFVRRQRDDVGVVAETIADLAGRSVPLQRALAEAEWPFPTEVLGDAVRRGYDQVPRPSRRLPLV